VSIMVGSPSVADDLPDRGRVGVRHVLRAVEWSGRREHGLGGERAPRKAGPIQGNEVLFDQSSTGDEIVLQGER